MRLPYPTSTNTCQPSSQPRASMDTQITSKGKLTMDHLLNLLAVHHSRTLRDLKKERPDHADLFLGKHNPGETVTAQKQAIGTHQKNTEQNARYLLTIITRPTKRASSKQPA